MSDETTDDSDASSSDDPGLGRDVIIHVDLRRECAGPRGA
jgi:hypothetical protein